MKRFKPPGHAQRFLAAHDGINNLFPSAAIAFPPHRIEPPGPRLSRSGPRSLALPAWHNRQRAQPTVWELLGAMSTKLTVPGRGRRDVTRSVTSPAAAGSRPAGMVVQGVRCCQTSRGPPFRDGGKRRSCRCEQECGSARFAAALQPPQRTCRQACRDGQDFSPAGGLAPPERAHVDDVLAFPLEQSQ